MTWSSIQKPIVAGLGLATMLLLAAAGCGGDATTTDDAVVVTDPSATVSTSGPAASPAGGAATGPATTSTGTTAAPDAPAGAAIKAEGWGTLKGQVTLGGDPPARDVLYAQGKATKDPEVCAKEEPILNQRLVVDGSTKGVKNVLVYIPKPTAVHDEAKSAVAKAEVIFDQENCVFEPHVLAVMNGATVQVKNSDPVNHNVNSRLRNNGFNSLLSGGQAIERPIEAAERSPGEVTCDIHPWMRAWWMVLDSPYFAVTDAQGNFEIKNVPAGTQKVVVWQEAAKFITPPSGQDVPVKPDDTTTVPFRIDAAKVAAQ